MRNLSFLFVVFFVAVVALIHTVIVGAEEELEFLDLGVPDNVTELKELKILLGKSNQSYVDQSDLGLYYNVSLNKTSPHASLPFIHYLNNDTMFRDFVNLTSEDVVPFHIAFNWSDESFFGRMFEMWW